MKKLIIGSLLLCTTLSAKGLDFENPNGEPFLMTVTFEKGGSIGWSLPVSKWVTLKMTPGGEGYLLTNLDRNGDEWNWATDVVDNLGSENDYIIMEEKDIIDLSKPTYSIDVHIPIYKLWKK